MSYFADLFGTKPDVIIMENWDGKEEPTQQAEQMPEWKRKLFALDDWYRMGAVIEPENITFDIDYEEVD